ncbi:MAG: hypothetical protein JNL49_11325 [Bacteroidia bacterium]|nr:hypothetical protein [Bacteroidia bacterium]
MKPKTPTSTPVMNTLTECSNKLYSQGFTENYKVRSGVLIALSDNKKYEPGEVKISNFFRFEGHSDPSDNAILYAVETEDGRKGMLIDAYGADADVAIGEFVKLISVLDKNTTREEK